MGTRSSRSMLTFAKAFTLPGYPDELPPGEYQIVVEEELLLGVSFEAYRRTATYLTVSGKGSQVGRTELRLTNEKDLEWALGRDRVNSETRKNSEAALSPLEDLI
ncbi:hypothetical protein IT775_20520 [Thalassobius aquimarinus]|uniref:Uncharacterized protein n=2 Tax=Thalassovita aquimarina TaxID=2785917 RepID=A0ABS5HYK3_9RHOB|nr:hypothetical protein [Thalassovita aquimarina]